MGTSIWMKWGMKRSSITLTSTDLVTYSRLMDLRGRTQVDTCTKLHISRRRAEKGWKLKFELENWTKFVTINLVLGQHRNEVYIQAKLVIEPRNFFQIKYQSKAWESRAKFKFRTYLIQLYLFTTPKNIVRNWCHGK